MLKIRDAINPVFNDIYVATNDRRKLLRSSSSEYRAHWDELNSIVRKHPHLAAPLRDTHCREAIMWWTHHITEEQREVTIPRPTLS